MTVNEVKRLYENRPFRPFKLNLADGRSVAVEHPEFMSFSPSGRTMVVYFKDGEDDSFEIIDLMLVTGLQVGGNGKHQGKK